MTLAKLQSLAHGGAWPQVSIGCLWKRLRQLGLTLKKVIARRRAKPCGYRQARDEWRVGQTDLNPEHLVFIDETGAKTNMVRLYRRASRGQRLVAPVPHGHCRLVFIATITLSGCAGHGAPSLVLFGAFFPAWMLCSLAGILGAVAARGIFVAAGLNNVLPYQLLVCSSAGLVVAIVIWLIWFG